MAEVTNNRCGVSPNSAHYWIEVVEEPQRYGYALFRCKWCGEKCWLPTTFDRAVALARRLKVHRSPGEGL